MKISEAILRRRSIRKFKEDPIPFEDLIKVMEAARWAPTAVNRQKTRFILVTDEDLLGKIAGNAKIIFYQQKHAAQAKAMIVVCLDSTSWIEEVGAAIQNILLMAYALSIGSCWIGAFNREAVREILKIPHSYNLLALILLGYYVEEPKPAPRLELGNMVFLNKWRNPIVKPKAGILPKSGVLSIALTKPLTDTSADLENSPLAEHNTSKS
ncbi:MAG: nitroreductase family protein [Promethearchaeota archaeon]|nr:MAG: nitroreductase family protein [Candidatus Lokiarchaeota archaeon]